MNIGKWTAACLGSALVLGLGLGLAAGAAAQARPAGQSKPLLIRCLDQTGPLARRWEWAQQTVRQQGLKDGYWIGYAIEKLMEADTYIGCFGGRRGEDVSLGTLLDGKESLYPSSVGNIHGFSGRIRFAGQAGHDRIATMVKKRIGVLFRFAKGGNGLPESVGATDDHFPVAFEGKPVLWLGPGKDEESLLLLTTIYDRTATGKLAERIVSTASIHEASAPVIPFLERVIKSRAPEDVRIEAVDALSGYPDERALQILVPLAKADSSIEVRKEAVSALGEFGSPEAVDALIAVARSGAPAEVREEAIDALAENISDRVLSAFEGIINKDPEQSVKEEAVEALAEIEGGAGLTLLIKVAKNHPDVEIRKSAVEALGESDDPRALKTLIELATEKWGQ